MAKEKIWVKWHPQWRGTASGGVITGYRVYAYIGHPLLGVVRGTEQIVKTETQAKKLAADMRKRYS